MRTLPVILASCLGLLASQSVTAQEARPATPQGQQQQRVERAQPNSEQSKRHKAHQQHNKQVQQRLNQDGAPGLDKQKAPMPERGQAQSPAPRRGPQPREAMPQVAPEPNQQVQQPQQRVRQVNPQQRPQQPKRGPNPRDYERDGQLSKPKAVRTPDNSQMQWENWQPMPQSYGDDMMNGHRTRYPNQDVPRGKIRQQR